MTQGSGATIASPLFVWLMHRLVIDVGVVGPSFRSASATSSSWWWARRSRVSAPGWKPDGYALPATLTRLITKNDVFVYDAIKTPQFRLIWCVLFLNTKSTRQDNSAWLFREPMCHLARYSRSRRRAR